MTKQKIIFYIKQSDVKDFNPQHTLANKTRAGIEALIIAFENGEFNELLVPRQFVTGWRTKLTHDECEITFVGNGWSTAELAQAGNRLTIKKEVLTPFEALQGSIKKWEDILNGVGTDRGWHNCPLCSLYYGNEHCQGCPVAEKVGDDSCVDTPYAEWSMHHSDEHKHFLSSMALTCVCDTCKQIAQKEVDFLKSLLPKET